MFGLGGKEAELFRDQMWSLVPMTIQGRARTVDRAPFLGPAHRLPGL